MVLESVLVKFCISTDTEAVSPSVYGLVDRIRTLRYPPDRTVQLCPSQNYKIWSLTRDVAICDLFLLNHYFYNKFQLNWNIYDLAHFFCFILGPPSVKSEDQAPIVSQANGRIPRLSESSQHSQGSTAVTAGHSSSEVSSSWPAQICMTGISLCFKVCFFRSLSSFHLLIYFRYKASCHHILFQTPFVLPLLLLCGTFSIRHFQPQVQHKS